MAHSIDSIKKHLLNEVRKQKPEFSKLSDEKLIEKIKGIKTTKKDVEKWLLQ